MKIVEYRGIEGLVCAEVTEDSAENYTTGEVMELAGTSQLSKETESSSGTKFYDNIPAMYLPFHWRIWQKLQVRSMTVQLTC